MSYERMQLDVSKQQNFSHRLGQILFSLVSLFSRHPIIIVIITQSCGPHSMSDSSNNLDCKNNARPSLFKSCSNFQQSWAQGEWHEPLFIRRAKWEIKNQLGDWNKTGFKFKWREGGVTETRVGGLREKEEETEICSNTPPFLHISPEIHRTTQISDNGWLQNFLWHYSGYLCFWIMHPHIVAYLYCVS